MKMPPPRPARRPPRRRARRRRVRPARTGPRDVDPATGKEYYYNAKTGDGLGAARGVPGARRESRGGAAAAAPFPPRGGAAPVASVPAPAPVVASVPAPAPVVASVPAPAPVVASVPASDWTAHVDPATGNEYYYNAKTGETVWERPEFGVPRAAPAPVVAPSPAPRPRAPSPAPPPAGRLRTGLCLPAATSEGSSVRDRINALSLREDRAPPSPAATEKADKARKVASVLALAFEAPGGAAAAASSSIRSHIDAFNARGAGWGEVVGRAEATAPSGDGWLEVTNSGGTGASSPRPTSRPADAPAARVVVKPATAKYKPRPTAPKARRSL
ncbi:hypothetical protein JL720_3165 [Aureococcus anophagefferens]|nr:hypothetical protein JL720_3165 [Aureococcus anophagefferens]